MAPRSFLTSAGAMALGRKSGTLSLILRLRMRLVNDVLFDQKPQERPDIIKPCSDRCDFEPPVLLVFDKCFQIVTDNLLELTLP